MGLPARFASQWPAQSNVATYSSLAALSATPSPLTRPQTMASVLVTGATGFIGYHLCRTLRDRGDDVTCLVRTTSNTQWLEQLGVALVYGDLTDRSTLLSAVAGKSAVYHAAGCVETTRWRQFFEVNEKGTESMAAICAEQETPPVLVTISSLAAVGPSSGGRLRSEGDPAAPVSAYGRSKRAGEIAAQAYADRVPITVVRPPMVLGEGDRKGLKLFKSIAHYRCHLVPGLVLRRYSVVHVADLVEGILLAGKRGRRLLPACQEEGERADTGCYFLAGREHPTYRELGQMVKAALCRPYVPIVPMPMPIVWLIASTGEIAGRLRGRAPFLNLDKCREVAAGSWVCSPQRAIDELGFSPGPPLVERLRQTIAWYRREGWL